MIAEVPGGGTERTWRQPVLARVAQAFCMGVVLALPAALLTLILVMTQVPDGGWIGLALAVALWGVLAWRAMARSVTLTPDTLVIRNILATEQIPLADITKVGFRGGRLTVTCAHEAPTGQWRAVSAANLGSSYWSGRRGNADALAEAIADAAGLPPLPPRRQIISRTWAWIMLLAAVLCFGLGVYCGPLQTGHSGLPLALREAGAVLYAVGAAMLGLAYRITRDHRRKRTRQVTADQQN